MTAPHLRNAYPTNIRRRENCVTALHLRNVCPANIRRRENCVTAPHLRNACPATTMTNTPPTTTPDAAEMARLFAQFLNMMGNATAMARRSIPLVPKLVRQEDFPVWRDRVINTLARYDLDRYITNTVPEPEDEAAKRQWRIDCADVNDYLQATVPSHAVWSTMKGMGWDSTARDPKSTFDLLTQYFEKGSASSNYDLLRELVNITRGSFDRMESFQERINYLRQRLESSPLKQQKDAYLWCALKAVEKDYTDLYNRSVVKMQAGTLEWGDLMAEFRQLAVTEASQPAMVTIKSDGTAATTTTSNERRQDHTDSDGITCATCNKKAPKSYTHHCDTCGWHNKGPVCWHCNPEQAPDTWQHKSLWVKRKAEREATAETAVPSTTGPLHQQSGVANPNNTTDREKKTISGTGNDRRVIFQTSNMALAMVPMELPDFRGGPQRL